MLTYIFPDKYFYTRLILVTVLSGVIVTSAIAQGKGNKPSIREKGNGETISHKVDTSDRTSNRHDSSAAVTDKGTKSLEGNTNRYQKDNAYRQDSQQSRIGGDKPASYDSYQSDRRERDKATDRPINDNRKPELLPKSDSGYTNAYKKSNNSDSGTKHSINTRDRVNSKLEQPSSHSDYRNNNGINRNNGSAVTHKVVVEKRDYRDRIPAYSQDRDRNDNRYRNHRPPTFRDGHYYYSAHPDYRPTLYGYWAFHDDPGFCRSVYFYYGYFPYMDTVRIHINPYIEVAYYGRPIVFDDDEYYLVSKATSELDYTLSDIRNSWLDGRVDLMDRHLNDGEMIAILLDGKYDYSIETRDYLQMTSDAIDQTKTISFTWEKVRKRTDGRYTAFGKHTYRDSEGITKIVYVSFTVKKIGSSYYITEVGSSREPLN